MTTGLPGYASGESRHVTIVQGEHHISHDPDVVLCTILGSCVAACLWDGHARVGGMNHFLLPGDQAANRGGSAGMRYGAYAMELLINDLLRTGARRERIQAKLFGGARMMQGLADVGGMNADFAERFLAAEGISVAGGSLRGNLGRRIQFWPISGRARQTFLGAGQSDVFAEEQTRRVPPSVATGGTVELF